MVLSCKRFPIAPSCFHKFFFSECFISHETFCSSFLANLFFVEVKSCHATFLLHNSEGKGAFQEGKEEEIEEA